MAKNTQQKIQKPQSFKKPLIKPQSFKKPLIHDKNNLFKNTIFSIKNIYKASFIPSLFLVNFLFAQNTPSYNTSLEKNNSTQILFSKNINFITTNNPHYQTKNILIHSNKKPFFEYQKTSIKINNSIKPLTTTSIFYNTNQQQSTIIETYYSTTNFQPHSKVKINHLYAPHKKKSDKPLEEKLNTTTPYKTIETWSVFENNTFKPYSKKIFSY